MECNATVRRPSANRAFTLVELMIATTLGAIVSIGVISSLTYLGRNLVRTSNITSLMSAASIATATLQKDVAAASTVTALGTTRVSLSVSQGGSTETVTYNWNAGTGELTRSDPSHSYVVLRNMSSCVFTFSDADSDPTTNPAVVKKIEFDATLALGSSTLGTDATHLLVSPAMIVAQSAL